MRFSTLNLSGLEDHELHMQGLQLIGGCLVCRRSQYASLPEASVYRLTGLLRKFEVTVLGLLPDLVTESLGHGLQRSFLSLIALS